MAGGIMVLPLNLKTAKTREIIRKTRAQKNIENS
jgi:hypothetical protein